MDKPIPLFKVFMAPSAAEEVGKTLNSGFVGQGPKVEQFEALLRERLQTPYVNTVNSCTSGLQLVCHNIKNFGKPMLELVPGELPDKAPLLGLKIEDALKIIEQTFNTDLLVEWQKECHPQKNQDVLKAIGAQMKAATSGINQGE